MEDLKRELKRYIARRPAEFRSAYARGRARGQAWARRGPQKIRGIFLTGYRVCDIIPLRAMKKKPAKDELTDALRRAALASGQSIYALARAARTSYAAMWTFMRGKGGLQLTTAGRLAHILGLELRPKRKRA